MRSSDDTYITVNDTLPPHTHNGARFNCTEQAGLQIERHITYLIKKKRATVGLFKFAQAPLAISTGKGTTFIAKEFCINQLTWDSCAIDSNKWPVSSQAVIVNTLGKNFFTRASFTVEKDGRTAI